LLREDLDRDRIFLIRGLLSADECSLLIERSEGLGFEIAPLGGVIFTDARNNSRVMFDDHALAADLFQRARPFLPDRVDDLILIGLNERFRFYRYTPGQSFKPHRDGVFERLDVWEESRLTFMVYLSSVAAGGETRFFADLEPAFRGVPLHSVQPDVGSALVFRHEVWHEGAEVRDGRKYVLRTDVMYRPDRGTPP
jgi:prolyl 4-hydroxylase